MALRASIFPMRRVQQLIQLTAALWTIEYDERFLQKVLFENNLFNLITGLGFRCLLANYESLTTRTLKDLLLRANFVWFTAARTLNSHGKMIRA